MRTQSVSFQTFSFNRILTIILITVMLLAAAPVISTSADSVGFYSPTKAASNGPGWTNPIYALQSDNLYATARKNNRQLKLSSFYIPAIPGGAVIDGIEVTVEGFTTGIQLEVALSGGGGYTSAKTTSFTGSESTLTLGGPTDTWGKNNWTATDFQNKFTVKLTTAATGGAVSIDAVQVKVYYTPPNTTLILQPVSGDYGGTTTMTATLKVTATNQALPGKTVTFSLNGTTIGSVLTDNNGVATYANVSLAGIIAGDYPYGAGASFAGDGVNEATSTTADLRVYGLLTTLTVSSVSGEYRGAMGDISATLKETVSGLPISGKTISFTLNEIPLGNVLTNASGVASVPGGSLTGYDAGTYAGAIEATFAGELNVEPATANGTLTVTPLPVTVTGGLTPVNKTYDGTTVATLTIGSLTLNGVVAPDVVSLDTSTATGTFSDKNVGTGKTVQISGLLLSGADADNYTLTQPTASATADIAARDLTVTAAGVNRAYDGTTSATVTLSSDAILTDMVTLAYTSASFADKDVDTSKPVAVSGISIGGIDAGNYNLLNATANTTADITPFEVTVNAHAKSKLVGRPDPTLTYSAVPSLFSSDTFTGALTRAAGEAVGQYPIQQGTLSAGSNYNITFVGADLTIVPITGSDLDVYIRGNFQENYVIAPTSSTHASYTGVNAGPVKVVSTNMVSVMAAERVIYKVKGVNTSYSEMMGLPSNQLHNIYWLPWYNNKTMSSQLRIANVSATQASVKIWIGGKLMPGTPFNLAPGASVAKVYPGIDRGPVKIVSNVDILASERVIHKANNVNTSFSELMAFPADRLNKVYFLPWYTNNTSMQTQLQLANVSTSTAKVRIFIGGRPMGGSFTLAPGASVRKAFPNLNKGPVKIVSNVKILASARMIQKVGGKPVSYSEVMGLPQSQLDTTYWLPWYSKAGALDTRLQIGNASTSTATVKVYINGVEKESFTLAPGRSVRKAYLGIDEGPVKVVSTVKLVVSARMLYRVSGKITSASEIMALPNKLLDSLYWLPWYNNKTMDTQLLFGVP